MPTMVSRSITMLNVDEDAKLWIVGMSDVIVLRRAPV